jgi:hypothetical protein
LLRNLNGYRQLGVDYVLTPSGQQLPQSPTGFQIAAKTPSAWLYHLSGAQRYFTAAGCRVHSADREHATLDCPRTATLIRRETDLPGWSATVNGHTAAIGRADGLFQTVQIPAGRHSISFSYAPPHIHWAELAFLAGILTLAASAVRTRRARAAPYPA